MVFPVVLGSGKPLFGEADAAAVLRLVDFKSVGSDGFLILTNEPVRSETSRVSDRATRRACCA